MPSIDKIFPILNWINPYNRGNFKGDLTAGLTVGVMLIPQGMAYAMIAGLPPIYGLYASLAPLIIYAVFGTSRQLAVGPVAMVSLLIATGVSQLAEIGSAEYIGLTILLALMVGLIQFLLGVFRLGFIVNFLSHPVISGFTSAAALIIGFSQLKHLLGIDIPRSNYIHQILIDAFKGIQDLAVPTFLIGLGAIALIIGLRKINKSIPGALIAVAAGILIVYLGGLNDIGVGIVGEIPEGLPSVVIPSMDFGAGSQLFGIALTIALVGFMESIAVAKAIQAKHKDYQLSSNQELIGLGLANIGGAFLQAFPTTGGFSRTAVNDQAGAKTGLAAIISAFVIALTLLFLTPLFFYLPNAILAAVIMVAVFGLVDFKEAIHLWKSDKRDFSMLFATFLGTLALGIEEGIILGVVLSLAMVIYRSAYPHMARLGKVPHTNKYLNVERFKELEVRDDVLVIRLDAQLYFANASAFREKISDLIATEGKKAKVVIISAAAINGIDTSAIHMLEDLITDLKTADVELFFAAVKGPVRDSLHKTGFTQRHGEDKFFLTVQDAVDYFDHNRNIDKKFVMQTNAVTA